MRRSRQVRPKGQKGLRQPVTLVWRSWRPNGSFDSTLLQETSKHIPYCGLGPSQMIAPAPQPSSDHLRAGRRPVLGVRTEGVSGVWLKFPLCRGCIKSRSGSMRSRTSRPSGWLSRKGPGFGCQATKLGFSLERSTMFTLLSLGDHCHGIQRSTML